jgi:hypothetical protein
MKKYVFFFLLLILTSCKKDEISSPSNNDENKFYPTTLNKLSQPESDSLQVKFSQKILGTNYLAKLDSFGLLGHYGVLSRGKSNISDPAEAISLAKTALLHLNEFSNVSDTSTLYVKEATNYHPSPPNFTDWVIIFKNQSYNGLEVWETEILTIVANDFILLDGHYYKNVFIPKQNIISKEHAKKNLIGKDIHYVCWTPGTYTIADSSINVEAIEQCIYPLIKTNCIELRVVWKIPISSAPGDPPMWYYFMDVLTGETVAVQELFIC